LYNIVLAAQDAAIEAIKPGNHWDQPHLAAVHVITKGLVELGLLQGDVQDLVDNEAYKKFYMHRTGHWLGLDVHDVGEYRFEEQWRVFEPGMVTTVEPGIYIDQGLSDVPRQYRGIGIRIEDNVLVTPKGNEVITSMIPRTVEEVEIYMSKKGSSD
jgi:Xaa-Pro aminopeptidase